MHTSSVPLLVGVCLVSVHPRIVDLACRCKADFRVAAISDATMAAGSEAALGPTAEEEVTDLVKSVVGSYRQLPVTLYQIQWKFRDETRPRFGLMRSKEFLMKDGYSFDVDAEAADKTYWTMYHAYERIFARCGLKAVPVEADGGDMGDSQTHEFHVLADAGEDGIAFCEACGYAANLEKATRAASPAAAEEPAGPVEARGNHR